MSKSIKYINKNFDQLFLMGTITKVAIGNFSELSIDDEAALQAIRRSTNELKTASLEEMSEYFSSMSPNSINGFINNTKGILHEVEWLRIENSDGDSIMVGLFPETNHEDYDIWAVDSTTGEVWTEQLKATKDKYSVQEWIEEHPDGIIRLDKDMAEELDLPTTGLDREELRVRLEDVIDKIIDSSEDDNIWNYFPALTAISVSFIIWGLYKRFKSDEIDEERFKKLVVRATGLKMAKIATLMLLLSIPVINIATGTAIIYRLVSSGRKILDS